MSTPVNPNLIFTALPIRDNPILRRSSEGVDREMCHCVKPNLWCMFASPLGSLLPGSTAWQGSGPPVQSELSHSAQTPTRFLTSRPLQLAGRCLISSHGKRQICKCHLTVYYHGHKCTVYFNIERKKSEVNIKCLSIDLYLALYLLYMLCKYSSLPYPLFHGKHPRKPEKLHRSKTGLASYVGQQLR